VNALIFVVSEVAIKTVSFLAGCINAGGTVITYSLDPLLVETSEAVSTVGLIPIIALKNGIFCTVTKLNSMI
jgi:hypothetical protein